MGSARSQAGGEKKYIQNFDVKTLENGQSEDKRRWKDNNLQQCYAIYSKIHIILLTRQHHNPVHHQLQDI
jgi:hypothetical protein